MKPYKSYLRQEMRSYLMTVPDATEQEITDLNVWVKQGNCPTAIPPILPMSRDGRYRLFML